MGELARGLRGLASGSLQAVSERACSGRTRMGGDECALRCVVKAGGALQWESAQGAEEKDRAVLAWRRSLAGG